MSLSIGKPELLLHICCAGCGVYISQVLRDTHDVSFYFYNPNIYPESEYKKRLEETERIANKYSINLIVGNNNHQSWLNKVKGLEKEKEKGRRCTVCYQDRLNKTAKIAKEKDFDVFTTTLTVSPHKVAKEIFRIGNELALRYDIEFLAQDFKKKDGFKKASALSKELNLYRQDYCGCEYSIRK